MRFLKYFLAICLFSSCNILPSDHSDPDIVDYVILFEAGFTEEIRIDNKVIGPIVSRLIDAIDKEIDVIIASGQLVHLLFSLEGKSDEILKQYASRENIYRNQLKVIEDKLAKERISKNKRQKLIVGYEKDIKYLKGTLRLIEKVSEQVEAPKKFLKKIKRAWIKAGDKWHIYRTKDKKFAVLVSSKAAKRAKKSGGSIDLKRLGLSNTLKKVLKLNIKKVFKQKRQEDEIDMRTFKTIFDYKSDTKKIVYLSGHGTREEEVYVPKYEVRSATISDLSQDEYHEFLSCMNKANCILLCASSCYAGGLNLLKMHVKHEVVVIKKVIKEIEYGKKIDAFKKIKDINFPIIICSLTDTTVTRSTNEGLKNFFDVVRKFFVEKRAGKRPHWVKRPFEEIIKPLLGKDPDLFNLPLIYLPGIIEKGEPAFFRVSEVDNKVKVITYPYLIAHELKGVKREKGKIKLKKEAIEIKNMKGLLIYPTIVNVPLKIEGPMLPKIISMIPGPAYHYIKKIDAGKINFRDLLLGLFKIPELKAQKAFFIPELTCRNYKKSGILHPDSPEKDSKKEVLRIKNLLIFFNYGKIECYFQLAETDQFFKCSLEKKKVKCEKITQKLFEDSVCGKLQLTQPYKSALFEATGGVESIFKFRKMINKHIKIFTDKELKPEKNPWKKIFEKG